MSQTMTITDLLANASELEPDFAVTGVQTDDVLEALRVIVGHGFYDGQSGDLDVTGVVYTCVGPFVLYTYPSGDESWRKYMSPQAAYADLRRIDDVMAQHAGEL